MANERIIPRPFAFVHPERRTPWVAIVFTSVVAMILVTSANITVLGGTTALLLLGVFTIVNIAVLVLRRRDPSDRPHFRALVDAVPGDRQWASANPAVRSAVAAVRGG